MTMSQPNVTIFAHRGDSAHAPENTLAAFELAAERGADGIELDAKLTADGEIVVIHDPAVDRTTDGTGMVAEMSLAALRELDAGSWFGDTFKGEQIPTLAEVFEAVGKRLIVNVELTNYTALFDPLPWKAAELVRQHKMEQQVLFSSFNPVALRRVHKALPTVPLGLLALPEPSYLGRWARSPLSKWMVPYNALHPNWQDVTPALIKREHAKGRRVHAWTVNDPQKIQQIIQWGADGIITYDPALAISIRDA